MPDPKFFKKASSFTLGDIASAVGATLANDSAAGQVMEDVSPLAQADAKDLSFLDNVKYKKDFQETKAGACIIHEAMAKLAPEGVELLISENPYKSYALAAQMFYPQKKSDGVIDERAHVSDKAKIGKNVSIACGAVIADGVEISDDCRIESGAVISGNVKIGKACRIGAHSTISHALIGDYVRTYPGVRIGQDGFGFAIDPAGYVKVPQLGRVIIEDHVEIGANTTIDRGAGPDTVIGQGTWIDNLVQIGHNVKIGKGCIIVAQVGLAGSTTIGDYVALGGQAGVAGHLTIGSGARIAAQSGVMRNVPDGEEQMGSPAMPGKAVHETNYGLKPLD